MAPAPIQSPLGWHVIRINKIEPGKVTPFDQVKEKIEKDLKAQLAPDLLIKLVTDFERSLGKTQSMAEAAEELGSRSGPSTTSIRAARMPRASRSSSAPPLPNWCKRPSPRARAARASCWKRQRGEYFVVHTDRITPARIPALCEVEAKVVEAWEREERQQARRPEGQGSRRQGEQRRRPRGDRQGAWPGAAHHQGGDALRGRHRQLPDAAGDAGAVQAGGRQGAVGAQRGWQRDRAAKEIQPADLAKEKDTLDRFGKQLDTMIANDLVAQLLAALRGKYGVTVNEQVFTAAFQQQPAVAAMSVSPEFDAFAKVYDPGKPQLVWTTAGRRPRDAGLCLSQAGRRPAELLPAGIGRGWLGARSLFDHRLQARRDLALHQEQGRDQSPRPHRCTCLRAGRRPAARNAAQR